MLQNIDNAMETLQICSFVLEILNKVIAKMESRKFYSALRVSFYIHIYVYIYYVSIFSLMKYLAGSLR